MRTRRELRGAWQNSFSGPKSEGIFCFTQGCYSLWDLKSWVKWEEVLGLHTATHRVSFLPCGRPHCSKLFQDDCVGAHLTVDGLPTFRHVILLDLEIPTDCIYCTKQFWLLDLTKHLLSSRALWLSTKTTRFKSVHTYIIHTYLPTYLQTNKHSKVCIHILYTPTYLPTYLPTHSPTYLPTYK